MTSQDLYERTYALGLRVARFIQTMPDSTLRRTLGVQLLRSATSVGANYRAAKRGRSRAEFISKLGIVEEEADETIYWIRLLTDLGALGSTESETLRRETEEILSITVASIRTARENAKKK